MLRAGTWATIGGTSTKSMEAAMSLEDNKGLVRRHFDELWGKGLLEVADEIYDADAVGHYAGEDQTGYPDVEKDLVRADQQAFPDGMVTVEFQVAEGDTVVTRWRFEGTHTGAFYDTRPTGRKVSVNGIHVHRLANGKIVEIWAHPDSLTFMSQLGLVSQ